MREYHKKIDDDPFNSLAALLVLRAHDVRNDRRIVAGIGFLLVIERRAFDTELHLHVRRGGDEICAHGGKFAMGIIDPAIKCVETLNFVVPAKAGIQCRTSQSRWVPAFAGIDFTIFSCRINRTTEQSSAQ